MNKLTNLVCKAVLLVTILNTLCDAVLASIVSEGWALYFNVLGALTCVAIASVVIRSEVTWR